MARPQLVVEFLVRDLRMLDLRPLVRLEATAQVVVFRVLVGNIVDVV